ncbi:MAG: DUF2085 domain-containing protein [Firmicutes bacterium]|nr:DUF2085 domain-containing protein [Bacillota bacterium]
MRLGKLYGCHQRADRSFFINGWQMPVCARCLGVAISTPIAVILFFIHRISVSVAFIMAAVMLVDWTIQFVGLLPSTNIRRLITGIIGGFGVTTIQFYIILYIYKFLTQLF